MSKRGKNKHYLILLFVLLGNLFVPTYTTYAYFSDTISEDVGIELSLGNVDLEFHDSNQKNPEAIIVKNNDPFWMDIPKINNNGSLAGKIYYKVDAFQTSHDGKEVKVPDEAFTNNNEFELSIKTESESKDKRKDKSKRIYSGDIGKFYPLIDEDMKQSILSPEETTYISFSFSSNQIKKVEYYRIQVTFLMTQSNGNLDNRMFHDELVMNYRIIYRGNYDDSMVMVNEEEKKQQVKDNTLNLNLSSELESDSKSQKKSEKDLSESNQPEELNEVSSEEENFRDSADVTESSPENTETYELLLDETFNYIPLQFDNQNFEIGITQEQFDWIAQFATIEEFATQITEETPALYIKYDKVTGSEDIEQYVYDLAEQKELGFEIELRTIPEEKLLEITFTKQK